MSPGEHRKIHSARCHLHNTVGSAQLLYSTKVQIDFTLKKMLLVQQTLSRTPWHSQALAA